MHLKAEDVLLRVRGLGKTFPGQVALSNVDLDVRAGEVHALVGQNGSSRGAGRAAATPEHQPLPKALSRGRIAREALTVGVGGGLS
jgi:ABC-type phosphonate transport system ATPase subunit